MVQLLNSTIHISEYMQCLQVLLLWHKDLLHPRHSYIAKTPSASTLIKQRIDKLGIDFRSSTVLHNYATHSHMSPDNITPSFAITKREHYLGALYIMEKLLLNGHIKGPQIVRTLGNVSTTYLMGYG